MKTEKENYWSISILEPDIALSFFFLQKSDALLKKKQNARKEFRM